jgi:hypothetical protein
MGPARGVGPLRPDVRTRGPAVSSLQISLKQRICGAETGSRQTHPTAKHSKPPPCGGFFLGEARTARAAAGRRFIRSCLSSIFGLARLRLPAHAPKPRFGSYRRAETRAFRRMPKSQSRIAENGRFAPWHR